jgi:uncharacterized membrane protein YagU involved in acid resistance
MARFDGIPLLVVVIVVASWQVTARSEDPNGLALLGTQNVVNGVGGDLSQYRVLSHFLAVGLQRLFGLPYPPFEAMRFAQCVVIFGLAYVLYGYLGLRHRTRLVGIGLLAGLMSLSLGRIGPSTFSLDRFTDTIFYLIAALLVVRGRDLWIPPLMVLAVANRDTSVFIPTLILAKHGPITQLFTNRRLRRTALFTAIAAWTVGAVVYFAIHAYYGPRTRADESFIGPAMMLRSLSMPGQIAFFFAALNLLPVLALLSLKDADPFLRRLFWLVVPLWLAIHIWAARLGEGIEYLAPTTIVIVPLMLQGLERRLKLAELQPAVELGLTPPRLAASAAQTGVPAE